MTATVRCIVDVIVDVAICSGDSRRCVIAGAVVAVVVVVDIVINITNIIISAVGVDGVCSRVAFFIRRIVQDHIVNVLPGA